MARSFYKPLDPPPSFAQNHGTKDKSLRATGRSGLFLVLAAALLIWHSSQWFGYTVDDAFISLRYGENLAEGHGLVFNAGQRVEGYSNLLWTLLFGLLSRVSQDPVSWIKLLGLGLGVLSLIPLFDFTRRAAGSDLAGLLAAFLVSVNGYVAVWLVGGLEGPLFLFELSWLALAAVRGWGAVAGLAGAALALTRPEGIALALLVAAERTLAKRRIPWWGLAPMAAVAGQMGFRLFYYGDWVPNTAHVKLGGGLPQVFQGLGYVASLLLDWGGLLGLVALVEAGRRSELRRELGPALVVVTGYLLFLVYCGGDYFAHYRLAVPILPLFGGIVIVVGFHGWQVSRGSPGWKAALLLCVGAVAFIALPMLKSGPSRGRLRHEMRMLQDFSIPAAGWLREHSPPGAVLALTAAGAIPYYSRLKIIDRFGLCDAEIARAKVPWTDVRSGISKYSPESVLRRKPDWILLDTNEWKLLRSSIDQLHPADRALLRQPDFRARYRLVHHWLGRPAERLALYVRKGSSAERSLR